MRRAGVYRVLNAGALGEILTLLLAPALCVCLASERPNVSARASMLEARRSRAVGSDAQDVATLICVVSAIVISPQLLRQHRSDRINGGSKAGQRIIEGEMSARFDRPGMTTGLTTLTRSSEDESKGRPAEWHGAIPAALGHSRRFLRLQDTSAYPPTLTVKTERPGRQPRANSFRGPFANHWGAARRTFDQLQRFADRA
jgi:hypothetical protein